MKYDITTKRLLEINAKAVLQEICGIDLKEAKLIDLPQEAITAKIINLRRIVSNGAQPQELLSLKMIDSPFFIEIVGKEKFILLLKWQAVWSEEKLVDLLIYKAFLLKKYKLPVKTVMVLFKEHSKARGFYKDNEVSFRFDLVKLYELEAGPFLEKIEKGEVMELSPFIPLMKGGLKLLDKALETLLGLKKEKQSADLLTAFFLFTSLVSKDKANLLRGKIMSVTTESPAYQWIKEEGKLEDASVMAKKGYPLDDIIEITGLTKERLEKAGINGIAKQ